MLESTRRKFMAAAGAAAGLGALATNTAAQQLPNESKNQTETQEQNATTQETKEHEKDIPYVGSDGWLHVPPGSLKTTTEVHSGMGGIGFNLVFDAEQPDHDQGTANVPGGGLSNGLSESGQGQQQGHGLSNIQDNAGGNGRGRGPGNFGGRTTQGSGMGGVGGGGSMTQESADDTESGAGVLSNNESNESR